MTQETRSGGLKLAVAFLAGVCLASAVVFGSGVMIERMAAGRGTSDPATTPPAKPDASQKSGARMDAYEMAQALKKGGYILYFRHPERQKWDSVIAFDVHEAATGEDASAQSYRDAVCLTPKGKEEAKMIGAVIKASAIPVGKVVSSPICRARQAADLAFGRIDVVNHGLIHTPVTNKVNADAFKQELKHLLTTVPIDPNTNTVISAHENTIRNHPDLFAEGTDLLKGPIVLETGLYVIQRDPSGELRVVQKYMSLGDLAANGIALNAKGPKADAGKAAAGRTGKAVLP